MQQVAGQIELLEEMQRSGVDLNTIEVINSEGIL
jgi:hypothetical protein